MKTQKSAARSLSVAIVRHLDSANENYRKAVRKYLLAEANGGESFHEHNAASYAKVKRDAYRHLLRFLKSNGSDHPRGEKL